MTDVSMQKRLAAEILGVGESRIKIDPNRVGEVAAALTKEDVRRLIKEGVITVEPKHGISRGRWKIRHEQRKKGRRRGHGKRKGVKTARMPKKELWMNRIRAIRKFLRMLRDKGVLTRKEYRRLYMLAKGGMFKSVNHLKTYIKEMISKK